MPLLHRNFPGYVQLASMWIRMFFTYRANIVFQLLGLLLQIFLLRVVWSAVYASNSASSTIPLSTVIAYLTLVNLQFTLLNPFLADYIQERVSKGLIVFDLLRPIGFLQQMFAGQIGATTGVLPFILAALPFAAVLGSLRPPFSLAALGFYLLSLALAYLLSALLSLLIGMIAFWTIEMSGFRMIYYFTSQFFAGAFIPLVLFPEPLRTVAGILPFQALASLPFSIYLGQLQGPALAQALLTQLAWVLILGLLTSFIWRLALRRVIIQGG